MKTFIVALVLIFSSVYYCQAQTDPTEAAYIRFPTIPPFTLLDIDSTNFTRDNLAKNKATLIMFFSPDCPHCQHQTTDLLADMDKLKNVQIIMATYQPMEELKLFNEQYKLFNYNNIKIGRDTKFFFPPFYRMKNLPYLALYDKHGKLLTTFDGNVKMDKLIKGFDKKDK